MNTFNIIIFIIVTCLLFSTIESRKRSKASKNTAKRKKKLEERYAPKILKWKEELGEICNALGDCPNCNALEDCPNIYPIIDDLEKHEGNKTHVLHLLQKEKRVRYIIDTIYLVIFILPITIFFIGNILTE